MPKGGKTLEDLVLVAAQEITAGDLTHDFAAERLLVQVWKHEPEAFGLRGYEREHPDANKLYTKLDGKKGLVARGLLEKSGERRFRLTRSGLNAALQSGDSPDPEIQAKLGRKIQDEIAALVGFAELASFGGFLPAHQQRPSASALQMSTVFLRKLSSCSMQPARR